MLNILSCFSISSMQFERNALNNSANIISPKAPSFDSTPNIDTLKYNLFHHSLNSDNYVKSPSTTSSEEGNSPTELNNCRKLLEKPPLVSTVNALEREKTRHEFANILDPLIISFKG